MALLFFAPLANTGRFMVSIIKAVIFSQKTIFHLITFNKNWKQSRDSFYKMARRSISIIKYGFLMQKAVLRGLTNPLEGRADFALCERKFNLQEEKADFKTAYYIAHCFQFVGNSNDRDYSNNMKKHLNKTFQFAINHDVRKITFTDQLQMKIGCTTWKEIATKYSINLEEYSDAELNLPEPQTT